MDAPQQISVRSFWIWLGLILSALLLGAFMQESCPILDKPGVDKLCHLLYMGLLATWLSRRFNFWVVLLVGAGVAFGIEAVQYFIPGRSCDVRDAIWGIAGTLLAWGLYQVGLYSRTLLHKIW